MPNIRVSDIIVYVSQLRLQVLCEISIVVFSTLRGLDDNVVNLVCVDG